MTRASRELVASSGGPAWDELPQFWNVLRGEMSVVWPWPERPEHIGLLESEVPFWNRRLLLKPGITGWAQIHSVIPQCLRGRFEAFIRSLLPQASESELRRTDPHCDAPPALNGPWRSLTRPLWRCTSSCRRFRTVAPPVGLRHRPPCRSTSRTGSTSRT